MAKFHSTVQFTDIYAHGETQLSQRRLVSDMYHKHFSYHITAPHIHDMNIYHDMTSHTYLHASHMPIIMKKQVKLVIVMNCIWLICILNV